MKKRAKRVLTPRRREGNRLRYRRIRDEIRELLNTLKNKPCMDCNQNLNPWQMDFDHRPGTKKLFEINKFVNFGKITTQRLNFLYEEIAKCDLVCANCHRNRTHNRS